MAWCSVKAQGQLYLYLINHRNDCYFLFKKYSASATSRRRISVFAHKANSQITEPENVEFSVTVYDEEIRDLYKSQSIISTGKSRRLRWAGHVAKTWEARNV
jgi:hypothetical protein